MLTKITVRNYRCLEEVEMPLAPLTALVGPNGSGKSAVLRSIDVLLGEFWPSLRSFRVPQDFTDFDTSREIRIEATFDQPYVHHDSLDRPLAIHGLRLLCRPYKRKGKWGAAGDLHADLVPLDATGEVPLAAISFPEKGRRAPMRPLSVGTELRDHAKVLFVDHRRSLLQHLPSARGSVLGKLLDPVRKRFDKGEVFRAKYVDAMSVLRTEELKETEAVIQDTAKRMLGFLGFHAFRDVQICLGFSDPANPFSSLRLQFREGGLEIPGEELGLGIQSAMVIGVFEAFRQLGGNFGTIVIEEPEMYLHPQAQRYFYRLLRDLSETGECQVIFATHSPVFADVSVFESLRLIRKSFGAKTRVAYVRPSDSEALARDRENQKLAGQFDSSTSEALFANEVLLVEGHADRCAANHVADIIGFDADAAGAAVIDCGGKNSIPLVTRVCRALGIPVSVMHDEDIWPLDDAKDVARQQEDNAAAEVENRRIEAALGDRASLFVLRPTLERCLGIGKSAKDKPRRVLEALRAKTLHELPTPLTAAVLHLQRGASLSGGEPAPAAPARSSDASRSPIGG